MQDTANPILEIFWIFFVFKMVLAENISPKELIDSYFVHLSISTTKFDIWFLIINLNDFVKSYIDNYFILIFDFQNISSKINHFAVNSKLVLFIPCLWHCVCLKILEVVPYVSSNQGAEKWTYKKILEKKFLWMVKITNVISIV